MTDASERPLLICYDGSQSAHHVLEWVSAAFPQRRVLVLTAWEPLLIFGSYPMMDVVDLDDAARKMAANGASRARELGLAATWTTAEASRGLGAAIVDIARAHDVPVIVMGSRGDGEHPLQAHWLGSVSREVTHLSDRALILVPSPVSMGHHHVGERHAEIATQT